MKRSRHAFTIIEVCVAAAVFSAVLGLLWSLTLLGRRGERAGDRDAAIEALLLAQERIESDLARIAADFTVAPAGDSITFACRPRPGSAPAMVTYRFDTVDGKTTFARFEDGKRSAVGGGLIGAVRFQLTWTPVGWMLRTALDYPDRQTLLFLTRVPVPS
jgi:type II secretory pathway pseudopilin PulG